MLPSLSVLSIYENRLNGTIPETIGNPSELKHLDVGFNSLEGVVSEAHFLNLSKSQHLDLSYNSLTSQFPSYWMQLG
jgi:Leucine-rich repeat (LRR) protein